MTLKSLFLLIILNCCILVSAQDTIVNNLQEVVVSDVYLKKYSTSQNIQIISDSIIKNNKPSLTSLLNYNTLIYFKENGLGMVSSPSFRGTTAQQTAVIWNGININSQLNGQTDFNTISTYNFSSIAVRSGGGSAIYGSSAIGGSIHLNTYLSFKKDISGEVQVGYGSFNTLGTHFNTQISTSKIATQIGFSRNSSDNDYEYIRTYNWKGEKRKNVNGQFSNSDLNANFGYKINKNTIIKLYSQTSNSYRNFSLISESDTKTRYVDNFSRNLVEFESKQNKISINLKNAFIYENYEYFASIDSESFSSGKVESFISKLDLGYKLVKSITINSVFDYNHSKGFGTSIDNKIREISSASIMATHKISNWQSEFVIRKEITNSYKSPILFSVGSSYFVTKQYHLKLNFSRNFRIPTYNDLYYNGGGGIGNPNLKPENSYQAELGNVITYKDIKLTQTVYGIKTNDLISWLPISYGNSSPENTNRVLSYGSETLLSWQNNIKKHYFNVNASYAYTISRNEETKKQLLYVPFHKLTASLLYGFKKLLFNYQFLYNGFVYKLSDNNPNQIVKSYKISNISINYTIGKQNSYKLGIQILNLFNQKYQSIEGRFMPGRNFNTYINFKF